MATDLTSLDHAIANNAITNAQLTNLDADAQDFFAEGQDLSEDWKTYGEYRKAMEEALASFYKNIRTVANGANGLQWYDVTKSGPHGQPILRPVSTYPKHPGFPTFDEWRNGAPMISVDVNSIDPTLYCVPLTTAELVAIHADPNFWQRLSNRGSSLSDDMVIDQSGPMPVLMTKETLESEQGHFEEIWMAESSDDEADDNDKDDEDVDMD